MARLVGAEDLVTPSALRKIALRLPDTEEGVACEGTALEKRTLRAGGKAFLFLGVGDAMLKLRESLDEAAGLAAKEPGRYRVGANGWVTVKLDGAPAGRLEAWIAESRALVAGSARSATKPSPRGRKTAARTQRK